jgi:hypothetical protein
MKGTWQTSNHGSGLLLVVAVAVVAAAATRTPAAMSRIRTRSSAAVTIGPAAAAVAAIVRLAAGPIVTAAEDLVRILLIAAGVLVAAAVAAIVRLVAWHRHRTPPHWAVQVQPPQRGPQRAVQVPAAGQSALPPQIHLHVHGPVSAADVAELIARQGNPQPAAIEEES